jgi:hypothetical protein
VPKSDALIESKSLRDSFIKKIDVLEKVKFLKMLPDDLHITVQMAADYFEVGKEAVKSLIKDNRDELNSDGLRVLTGVDFDNFVRSLKDPANFISNKTRTLTIIPRRAILRMGMILRDSLVARGVRNYLLNTESESRNEQPKSIEDLIIMQAQSVKELKEKVSRIETNQQDIRANQVKLNHRIENIDSANIDGDKQQRLNKMMRRFAWHEGIPYQSVWKLFDQAFNNAFHTNITTKRNNYAKRNGIENITRPKYLSATGQLDDALRVADKMLNQEAGVLNA